MKCYWNWGIPLVTLLLMAQAPANDALNSLNAQLHALRDVRTLKAHFFCEKDLAALDTPLESQGRVWIQKAAEGNSGGVRFSTEKPYVSELILTRGKVYARSQHESDWTTTNQSSRPGLTAVMSQLGNWSTGTAARLSDYYTVSEAHTLLPHPQPRASINPTPLDVFTLTPTNKDLSRAVKQVILAIDPQTHYLCYIEIQTRQNDSTRYWFTDVHTNVPLPADIFKPTRAQLKPEEK